MNRKLTVMILAGSLALSSMTSVPAWADATKVVTLGVDLTEDQQTAILKYFGIYGNSSVETLIITNQDERDHLASYVPIEQIGSYTFSCALVNPTSSGGIQVKTANLNWVTGNMIASTLSTAGVVNCEVLAASPFEVSGTGALTGVIMAYEQASGTTLDEEKKELATQELVTTGTIASEIGQDAATSIVNEVKIQIIEGQVIDTAEVEQIVEEVVDNSSVTVELSDEDRQLLNDLASQIAQQQYNYEEVKETLQRVEENTASAVNTDNSSVSNDNSSSSDSSNSNSTVITIINNNENNSSASSDSSSTSSADSSSDSSSDASASNEDSIMNNVDVSALQELTGSDVITTTTDESEIAEEAQNVEETQAAAADAQSADSAVDDGGIQITVSDEYSDGGSNVVAVQDETAASEPQTSESQAEETPVVETSAPETQAEEPQVVETPVPETQAEEIQVEETPVPETQAEEIQVEETPAPETQAEEIQVEETPAPETQTEEIQVVENQAEETQQIEETAALSFVYEPEFSTENLNVLKLLFPADQIVPVSGTVTVKDTAEDSIVASVDITDSTKVRSAAVTVDEYTALQWDQSNGGTAFVICLNQPLSTGKTYTAEFNGIVAQSADSEVTEGAPAAEVSLDYTFTTSGYGIVLSLSDADSLIAGNGTEIRGSFLLSEGMTSAYISGWNSEYLDVITYEDGSFGIYLTNPGTSELTATFISGEEATGTETIKITAF